MLAALSATTAHADTQCPGPAPTWVDQDKTEVQGTRPIVFPSATVKQEVSALLYLPPGYDANAEKRYPVVYWLHGMCGHAWNGNVFVRQLDDAIRNNQAEPMIAVLVNGMSDSYYFDSPDGHWPVESVIVKDLVPYVDRSYRTIAARESRAVEGFSMGGFGAAHLAFKYPDVFGVAVIDAGAFNTLESFKAGIPTITAKMLGDAEYFDRNDPMILIRQNAEKIRGRVRIRIAVGDQDGLQPVAQQLHETMKTLRIDHEYEVVPGVGHDRQLFYALLRERPFTSFFRRALSDTKPN
jgi:endo-1,4-beta-xylanase